MGQANSTFGIVKDILTNRRSLAAVAFICAMAAVTCWGIALTGSYFNRLEHEDEKRLATKEAELSRDAFEIHTRDLLNYVDTILTGLRAAYLRQQSLDDARYFVEQLAFNRSVLEDVAVVSASGQLVLWSGNPDLEPVDLSDRGYFQRQRQATGDRLDITHVEFGRVSGKFLFRVSRRIVLPDGSFGGLVMASVNPQAISRIYQDLRIGRQSTTMLVGSDDRRLRARYPHPSPEQWQLDTSSPLWQALSEHGQGSYEASGDVDGVTRNFVFRKLENYPLAVVVGFSAQDVADRIQPRQERQRTFEKILMIAVLGISLLLIVITVHRQRLAAANRDLQNLYDQVRGLALFDALTGLPNRSLLDDRLAQALRDAERNQESCALMYLDLDDFKQINDSIGHDAGDHVLTVTASRMGAAVRSTDTVSRRGGDEFVILLPHAGTLEEVLEIADRLVQWVAEPIAYQGRICKVSASVGVAIFPEHGRDIDEMLKAADAAMYEAKRQGKNTIVLAASSVLAEAPREPTIQ